MGPRRNLELKARDRDPARSLRVCRELGAEDKGTLVQRDTYFEVPRGRLKLREEPDAAATLIAYERPDLVVGKVRRLFIHEGVRIHLDRVDDLGDFIEFEDLLRAARDVGDRTTHLREAKVCGRARRATRRERKRTAHEGIPKMLAVSEEAASAIGSILAAQDLPDEAGLRVSTGAIESDSGPQTALRLEIASAPAAGDQVLEEGPVFLESDAAELLDDKVLDAEVRGDQIQFSVKAQK